MRRGPLLLVTLVVVCPSEHGNAAETPRRLEEIVVTAEKRESTVSDTSLSITAFGQTLIEQLAMQNADDLVQFLPATTRDDYDVRIRGVGRNFRALGGDPGVATYYNGVYSEDFLIAATESALYDLERVEVLRGPQGTLYGRNAIGGAINYITNRPSYETDAEVRVLIGNLDSREFYGYLSGPILDDRLAYRLVGAIQNRDGSQPGIDGSEDVNSVDDRNVALSLNWRITDDLEFNARWNDRRSDRILGAGVLVTEGPITSSGEQLRGRRSTNVYALGMTSVPDPIGPLFGGAIPARAYSGPVYTFANTDSGEERSGIYVRPGVDPSALTRLNPAYHTNPDVFDPDLHDLEGYALTNNRNAEKFLHNAVQADLNWQLNETTELRWIGGWMNYEYSYWSDADYSTSSLTQYHSNVSSSLESFSNELQLFWQIGDSLQMTSGLYQFKAPRRQQYAESDDANQGRYTRAAGYGFLVGTGSAPVTLGDAAPGFSVFGDAGGTEAGLLYGTDNEIETRAYAAFTQGTYTFSDHWALTLGLRWARDEKSAQERRGGYAEIPQSSDAYAGFCLQAYGLSCDAVGLTGLAAMNMLIGAASFVPTLDPNMPITPTCQGAPQDVDPLTYADCATPLRLAGFPISWADAGQPSEDHWEKVTWRINLDWTPTPDHLVYLGATTGYRAGGYSLGLLDTQTDCEEDYCFDSETGTPLPGRTGPSASYGAEDVLAVELGYKGGLFDDRLLVFTAVYVYDYRGYQDEINEYEPETGGQRNVVVNADKARNMGWEIEGAWLATDNWTIGGSYSLAGAEYRSDLLVVEDNHPSRPESLFTSEDENGNVINQNVVNLKGNQLKGIPRHNASVYSWYDWRTSSGVWTFGGSFAYTGSVYNTAVNRSFDRTPSGTRLDLSVAWRDLQDKWLVRAFLRNATDDGRSRGVGNGNEGANWVQTGTILYPRFYGLDISCRVL